jgi:hypothetical protein
MDNGRIAVLGLAAALGIGTTAAVLEYRTEASGAEIVQLSDDDLQAKPREDGEDEVLVAEDDLGEGDDDVNVAANETTNGAAGTGGATTGGQAGDTTQDTTNGAAGTGGATTGGQAGDTTQAGGGGFIGGGGTDDGGGGGFVGGGGGGTDDGGGGGDT